MGKQLVWESSVIYFPKVNLLYIQKNNTNTDADLHVHTRFVCRRARARLKYLNREKEREIERVTNQQIKSKRP